MTISEIECFLSICEHKTASRAAESLYITQPSLSSRLKTLERELGGELFIRKKGSREMMLTPAGKEFYTLALQYEELIRQMHSVFNKRLQKLRVSSINSLDTFLLPQVYERFLQQYPEIELEIQDMELSLSSRNIHTGDTDIAF
ncbi:MAG: LysR family transcriptional regulator, partial [Clostridia bacterium]|nr:LysR family transcriptional regulator [Clostridia bacterium]